MQFAIYQSSRKGARKVNQDCVAHTYGRESMLLVVADGVGGSAGGEVASQICARLLVDWFVREAKPVVKNPRRFLYDSMLRAHAALGSYADQVSMDEAPRTTCVACVVQGGRAYWAHVGDSRLYLFRQRRLLAETLDHSHVQYLLQQGRIEPDEVATHPERHRIFSCLGGEFDPVIDLDQHGPLADGDLLVLSTDGFWSMFAKDEIAAALSDRPVLEAAPALIGEAERRSGEAGDNLSAVMLRWGPEAANKPTAVRDEARNTLPTLFGRRAPARPSRPAEPFEPGLATARVPAA
jgi:PPM family protein phosphatase